MPRGEPRKFFRNDGFGTRNLRAAPGEIVVNDVLQVVHVVEKHLFDFTDGGVDVPWNRDVDDEERVRAPAAGGRFDIGARNDRTLRSSGGDHDVRVGDGVRHVAPRDGAAGDLAGQGFGLSGRAVRDHNLGGAMAAKVLSRQRADLAGADDENAAALQVPEDLSREGDGGKADRNGAFPESGLRTNALPDAKRPMERLAEQRSRAATLGGRLKGILYLAENLGFANHQ